MYCTISDIKVRLGIATSTEFDTLLTGIVAGVSGMFNRECRGTLLATAADVTERYRGGCDQIQLRRYPVISITSVKETYGDYDFAGADPLVENTDWIKINNGLFGIIKRLYLTWPAGPDTVQFVYRGGYLAAGQTPAENSGDIVLPDELREATIEQCSLLFKRRDDIGLSSQSFQGGSLNVFSKLELEPLVKQVLSHYTRKSL